MPRRSNVDLDQIPNRPAQNQDAFPTRFDFLEQLLGERGGRDGPLGGRFADMLGDLRDRGDRDDRVDAFPRCPQDIKVDDTNALQVNHDWFFGG